MATPSHKKRQRGAYREAYAWTSPKILHVGRLIIVCTGRYGIISQASSFLRHEGANIGDLEEHSSGMPRGQFFSLT